MKGRIIMINGVSSSGKTTLAKKLQNSLETPFYLIQKDDFTKIIPYLSGDFADYAKMVQPILFYAIKEISDNGRDVIVDTLFQERLEFSGMLKECVSLLKEYPILFVKTICPLDELQRREKNRDDSSIGKAETQLKYLVPQDGYDLVVDTHNDSIVHNVDLIKAKLSQISECTAFKELTTYFAV